jgi:tRNA-dependent cyclodipeptide synthase
VRKYKADIFDIAHAREASEFQMQKAYCCVSLSNPNYYNKRLDAVIKFLVSNFSESLIITSGLLYRKHYELFNGDNKELSLKQALDAESNYINEELKPALQKYDGYKIHFLKWSELYNDPCYKLSYEKVNDFYRANDVFRNSINNTARLFIEKKAKNNFEINGKKSYSINLSIVFYHGESKYEKV